MKWIKILLIWFCFIPIAILNGGFREHVLDKCITAESALAISGILLSLLIFLTTRLLFPYVYPSKRDCIPTGLLWGFLTIGFELAFGLSAGNTCNELAEAYNPLNGNLWILVVLSTVFSPILVYRKLSDK